MWEILFQIFLLIVGFVLLVKGADFFVESASSLANKLHIPELVIGLTIVAMGTSAPEAAVSITAALKGSADITVGNILGSNILNILIILGLTSLFSNIKFAKSSIKIDIPFMMIISILLLLLGLDGGLQLIDGIIMLVIFVVYLAYLFIDAKKNPAPQIEETTKNKLYDKLWFVLLMIIVGLGMIILGSTLAVDSATYLARQIGVSERFIGLTIVALGTSLPELFTSVVAARKGNADIAIGNIVGSNIFNILFVVGLSSTIITVPFASDFIIDAIVAIVGGVILFVPALISGKLNKKTGIIMLFTYAVYFAFLCIK